MKTDPEVHTTLAAERERVLDITAAIEGAETREGLALALSELRGVLQQHFLNEHAAGIGQNSAVAAERDEILANLSAEMVELRAEIDGVWREHREARDALVRLVRRHEDTIARALQG